MDSLLDANHFSIASLMCKAFSGLFVPKHVTGGYFKSLMIDISCLICAVIVVVILVLITSAYSWSILTALWIAVGLPEQLWYKWRMWKEDAIAYQDFPIYQHQIWNKIKEVTARSNVFVMRG